MPDAPLPLKEIIGPLVQEPAAKSRCRFHQGWWRAFVLGRPPGPHPYDAAASVCNTMVAGEISQDNFIGDAARVAVKRALEARRQAVADGTAPGGIIEETRLYNNLLSSQPLAFNFFGEFQQDLQLATKWVQQIAPCIDEVLAVHFEFAPTNRVDSSAFDVALHVRSGARMGLFGIECKYTDSFSVSIKKSAAYAKIHADCHSFIAPHSDCMAARFNQLYRNQLIAEKLVHEKAFDFRLTGLLCHEDDHEAQQTGAQFQLMLADGKESFHVLTYARFIELLQLLPLSWQQRCWSMMLWARYCAVELSAAAYGSEHSPANFAGYDGTELQRPAGQWPRAAEL